jgi:hypothetical protein
VALVFSTILVSSVVLPDRWGAVAPGREFLGYFVVDCFLRAVVRLPAFAYQFLFIRAQPNSAPAVRGLWLLLGHKKGTYILDKPGVITYTYTSKMKLDGPMIDMKSPDFVIPATHAWAAAY